MQNLLIHAFINFLSWNWNLFIRTHLLIFIIALREKAFASNFGIKFYFLNSIWSVASLLRVVITDKFPWLFPLLTIYGFKLVVNPCSPNLNRPLLHHHLHLWILLDYCPKLRRLIWNIKTILTKLYLGMCSWDRNIRDPYITLMWSALKNPKIRCSKMRIRIKFIYNQKLVLFRKVQHK